MRQTTCLGVTSLQRVITDKTLHIKASHDKEGNNIRIAFIGIASDSQLKAKIFLTFKNTHLFYSFVV